jgi:glutaconate CoA-transferase, subunit B
VHQGVSVDNVRAATGWDLAVADDIGTTDPPTRAELDALRSMETRGGAMRGGE